MSCRRRSTATSRSSALALALALAAACTTPSSNGPTGAVNAPATPALEALASSLARDGMSTALPPRVCAEDPRGCAAARVDDELPCVHACGADDDDVLRAYARALVRAHLPGAPDARGDELAAAYLAHDDVQLAHLATAVERDFDAARAKPSAPKRAKLPPKRERDVADAGVAVVDAGAGAAAREHEHEHERERERAAAVDAGVRGGLHDKLVGTWASADGPVHTVYALCDDGHYALHYEVTDEELAFASGDLPTGHGTWEALEGDPPRLALSGDGEREEATLTFSGDDTVEAAFDAENVLRVTRRSRSATCD